MTAEAGGRAFLPGIFVAVDEGRLEDAMAMANDMIKASSPVRAVLLTAAHGLYLQKLPEWSVQQLAVMQGASEAGVALADSTTAGEVGLEFLDIIEGLGEGGAPDEKAARLLEQFEKRPGSGEVVRMMAWVTQILVLNLQLQALIPMSQRSTEARQRFAFESARAALRGDPGPDLFDPAWNDGSS